MNRNSEVVFTCTASREYGSLEILTSQHSFTSHTSCTFANESRLAEVRESRDTSLEESRVGQWHGNGGVCVDDALIYKGRMQSMNKPKK